MSYAIPLGTLQRLAGHEHYRAVDDGPARWDLDEKVTRSVENCVACKTVAEAFEEGHNIGWAEGNDHGDEKGYQVGYEKGYKEGCHDQRDADDRCHLDL